MPTFQPDDLVVIRFFRGIRRKARLLRKRGGAGRRAWHVEIADSEGFYEQVVDEDSMTHMSAVDRLAKLSEPSNE